MIDRFLSGKFDRFLDLIYFSVTIRTFGAAQKNDAEQHGTDGRRKHVKKHIWSSLCTLHGWRKI